MNWRLCWWQKLNWRRSTIWFFWYVRYTTCLIDSSWNTSKREEQQWCHKKNWELPWPRNFCLVLGKLKADKHLGISRQLLTNICGSSVAASIGYLQTFDLVFKKMLQDGRKKLEHSGTSKISCDIFDDHQLSQLPFAVHGSSDENLIQFLGNILG